MNETTTKTGRSMNPVLRIYRGTLKTFRQATSEAGLLMDIAEIYMSTKCGRIKESEMGIKSRQSAMKKSKASHEAQKLNGLTARKTHPIILRIK
jgi:hypothetical protein